MKKKYIMQFTLDFSPIILCMQKKINTSGKKSNSQLLNLKVGIFLL